MTGRVQQRTTRVLCYAPLIMVLIAAVYSGYLAPCATGTHSTSLPLPAHGAASLSVTAPHDHDTSDDCGAAIHNPNGLHATASPQADPGLVLLPVADAGGVSWQLLPPSQRRSPGARSPPMTAGRTILVALCVARI